LSPLLAIPALLTLAGAGPFDMEDPGRKEQPVELDEAPSVTPESPPPPVAPDANGADTPASQPGGQPPAVPSPAQPPSPSPRDPSTPPPAIEPGPAGSPLDVVPAPPLEGLWGYGAEVAAATGVRALLSYASCIPIAGPVLYALFAPSYIVAAIEYVASGHTTTGEANRGPALVTTYIVEGVSSFLVLGSQAVLLGFGVGVGLVALGAAWQNPQLTQNGEMVLGVSLIGAIPLTIAAPITILLQIAGPHLEVLAYRYFELSAGPVPVEE